MSLSRFLDEVQTDWKASSSAFGGNVWPPQHWPIPFFGNPKQARVLTVGVNPSSGEFAPARRWDQVQTDAEWKVRLRDYFNHVVPPHEWFDPWTFGLSLLGLSYQTGTAAHADVSYRPTLAMSNERTNPGLFRDMAERDAEWLFRLLPMCPDVRLLLTYGPILRADGRYDGLFQFVANAALRFGYDVRDEDGFTVLIDRDTWQKLFLHDGATRGEKCLSCSVAKNLHTNRERLKRLL